MLLLRCQKCSNHDAFHIFLDLHSAHIVTTSDNLAPSVHRDPSAYPRQIAENVDINCHSLDTVSQRVDEEIGNNSIFGVLGGTIHNQPSDQQKYKNTPKCKTTINYSVNLKQRQQKTVTFKFPKSMNDAPSRKRQMNATLSISPASACEKELYANHIDFTFSNKSIRPDNPMDN